MSKFTSFLFVFIAFLFLAASAFGQAFLLYQKNGAAIDEYLGFCIDGVGDINADGRADFIVGANGADPGGDINAGSVFVYSGLDGSILYQKDGDNFAGVYSFGISVAGAGDVNGDGTADFIVGAPYSNPGGLGYGTGSAFVYSGATGALLYRKDGAAGDELGRSVAGAGDVNGDGRADFIIGAALANPGGLSNAGSAFVYSGMDGSLLYQKNGLGAESYLGFSTDSAGDINADGRADFIVGANGASRAFVYSGMDGSILYQKIGLASTGFGISVAGTGDVNGDGRADFIVGAHYADPGGLTDAGSAFVYSGATGALLFRKDGAGLNYNLGSWVAGAGDVNGDGKTDFIIGAERADPGGLSDAGLAFVYALCPASPARGDMNGDMNLSPADVVLELNCVFLGTGNCSICLADVNCDETLSPADVVIELNGAFLGTPITCPP